MSETFAAVVAWAAPIASTLIVCGGQLALNSRFKRADEKRDADRAATEEKRREEAKWREEDRAATEAKRKAEAEWRDSMSEHMRAQDRQMSLITTALQSTMRATLIHNAEKYFSRGTITPEEQASWCDMHDRYSAMGFNGLIDSYRDKIDRLPHVTVESLVSEKHEL